MIENLIKL